ncbi:MAG: hypothetical protein ABIO55_06485 [Ginsengibacter sp.]
MRKTFLFSLLILLLSGCKKDKFTTAPQLKYKSANTTTLGRFQTLSLTLSFTDAEGDIANTLTVLKIVKRCPNGSDGSFVQPYTVPSFPAAKNQQGDIIVSYSYNDVNPLCSPRNDTAIFKFVLKDKADHISDTAVSQPIIITN